MGPPVEADTHVGRGLLAACVHGLLPVRQSLIAEATLALLAAGQAAAGAGRKWAVSVDTDGAGPGPIPQQPCSATRIITIAVAAPHLLPPLCSCQRARQSAWDTLGHLHGRCSSLPGSGPSKQIQQQSESTSGPIIVSFCTDRQRNWTRSTGGPWPRNSNALVSVANGC